MSATRRLQHARLEVTMHGTLARLTMFSGLVLALSMPASATDFYVSSSLGDDGWSGTLPDPNPGHTDGPKQSLAAAAALLDATAQPGDRVLLRRGDTWTGSSGLSVSTANGTPASPIVCGAYGSGAKPVLDISGTGNVISVRGSYNDDASAYLRFENLRITTTAAPGNRPIGILVLESYRPYTPHHITFSHCEIEGLKHGLTLYQNHHVIESCVIRNNYGMPPETGHTQGLYTRAEGTTIRSNLFENNGRPDSWFDHNLYMSHGTGYLIEGNTIRNSLDGIKLRGANNTVVRDNVIHGMGLGGIGVGGDDSGRIENVVIERNLIYDTVNGITVVSQSGTQTDPSTNITIRNNILHSNQQAGPIGGDYGGYVTITDPIVDVFLINNVIHGIWDQNERNLYVSSASPSNLQIKNNVFARTDTTRPALEFANASALSSVDLDHNLYHYPGGVLIKVESTSYLDLATFRGDHPLLEAGGVEGDPELANPPSDFHLTAASTLAIDTGADAPGLVDDDFDGAPRPWDGDDSSTAEWDIGPYEFLTPFFVDGFESGDTSAWS
jgi:parallel beta-helix repeat protein